MEYSCSICKVNISPSVYEYSMNHFSKALCIKHQELEKQKLSCNICKQSINQTVYNYSIERYGKPLCIHCQKIVDEWPKKKALTRSRVRVFTAVNARSRSLFKCTKLPWIFMTNRSAKIAKIYVPSDILNDFRDNIACNSNLCLRYFTEMKSIVQIHNS